jgi:hypothetical protein
MSSIRQGFLCIQQPGRCSEISLFFSRPPKEKMRKGQDWQVLAAGGMRCSRTSPFLPSSPPASPRSVPSQWTSVDLPRLEPVRKGQALLPAAPSALGTPTKRRPRLTWMCWTRAPVPGVRPVDRGPRLDWGRAEKTWRTIPAKTGRKRKRKMGSKKFVLRRADTRINTKIKYTPYGGYSIY